VALERRPAFVFTSSEDQVCDFLVFAGSLGNAEPYVLPDT
jgi:hypothetical protein